MSIWDEILQNILQTSKPSNKPADTKSIGNAVAKIKSNSFYMNKARESLGDVANQISKDTLQRIARTIKDNEKATKYRTTGPDELEDIAANVVKGKTVKVSSPSSERYISNKGRSPYTKGEYSIDKDDDKQKEVNISSTAVDEASYDAKTHIASIKFHGGDKWYNYVATPEDWEAFLKSPSKGRWIHDVWTPNNWLPGYQRKKRR